MTDDEEEQERVAFCTDPAMRGEWDFGGCDCGEGEAPFTDAHLVPMCAECHAAMLTGRVAREEESRDGER